MVITVLSSLNSIEANAQLDVSAYRACKNTNSLSFFIAHIQQRTEVSKKQKLFLDSVERERFSRKLLNHTWPSQPSRGANLQTVLSAGGEQGKHNSCKQ